MPMPRAYAWLKEGETCRYCIGSGAALGGRCKHCGGLGKTFDGQPRQACVDCDGQGRPKGATEMCKTCGGKGWEEMVSRPTVACRFCMGSGTTVGGGCKHCGGAGRMEVDKEGHEIDLALLQQATRQKCPFCLGLGYKARGMTCEACGGSGFKAVDAAAAKAAAASAVASGAATPARPSVAGGPAAIGVKAPEISQGNPLAQAKFGAASFCKSCGTAIAAGKPACPKCGKPAPAPKA